jgi:hypothetical protein
MEEKYTIEDIASPLDAEQMEPLDAEEMEPLDAEDDEADDSDYTPDGENTTPDSLKRHRFAL